MISSWRWAAWIAALSGIFVFLITAAVIIGWNAGAIEEHPHIQTAGKLLSTTHYIKTHVSSLKESLHQNSSLEKIRTRSHELLNTILDLSQHIGGLRTKADLNSYQLKPLAETIGTTTGGFLSYLDLIKQAESSKRTLEKARENAVDSIRILLYNLVIQQTAYTGEHPLSGNKRSTPQKLFATLLDLIRQLPADNKTTTTAPPREVPIELRSFDLNNTANTALASAYKAHTKYEAAKQRAAAQLTKLSALADDAANAAVTYHEQRLASLSTDNRNALTAILLTAILLWLAINLLALKLLRTGMKQDPPHSPPSLHTQDLKQLFFGKKDRDRDQTL